MCVLLQQTNLGVRVNHLLLLRMRFCTTVRMVSPGVLIAPPNTPAQNPLNSWLLGYGDEMVMRGVGQGQGHK